jgi:hypothetical protein
VGGEASRLQFALQHLAGCGAGPACGRVRAIAMVRCSFSDNPRSPRPRRVRPGTRVIRQGPPAETETYNPSSRLYLSSPGLSRGSLDYRVEPRRPVEGNRLSPTIHTQPKIPLAGLGPAIHVFLGFGDSGGQDVDARNKSGQGALAVAPQLIALDPTFSQPLNRRAAGRARQ